MHETHLHSSPGHSVANKPKETMYPIVGVRCEAVSVHVPHKKITNALKPGLNHAKYNSENNIAYDLNIKNIQ